MGVISKKRWMYVTKIIIQEIEQGKNKIVFSGKRLDSNGNKIGEKISEDGTIEEAIELLKDPSIIVGKAPQMRIQPQPPPFLDSKQQIPKREVPDVDFSDFGKDFPKTGEINILGFIKVKNEILKGNLFRCLTNLKHYCDEIVAFDDNSTDGTREYLEELLGKENVISWDRTDGFENELVAKQKLLELALSKNPRWILWLDGDEVLDKKATLGGLLEFCNRNYIKGALAYRMHETQLWNSTCWARIDSQFDDGSFIRLWRVPDDKQLHFKIEEGTHHSQFPIEYHEQGAITESPFQCIHYGNASLNHIRSKIMQYHSGLGGWERHLNFEEGNYRYVSSEIIPPGAEWKHEDENPKPFSPQIKEQIINVSKNNIPGKVIILMPTFNKGEWIEQAIRSVVNQTYHHWELYILDDNSNDNTYGICEELMKQDARIFYIRYPENRGACILTNVGIKIALERGEFFTIIGSDDVWGENKLQTNIAYLNQNQGIGVCYAPYQVLRKNNEEGWDGAEICNEQDFTHPFIADRLDRDFCVSIANMTVRKTALKLIKEKFGDNYCESPTIRQMNDWILNWKLSKVATFGWHPGCEAYWRDNTKAGASHVSMVLYNKDRDETIKYIAEKLTQQ